MTAKRKIVTPEKTGKGFRFRNVFSSLTGNYNNITITKKNVMMFRIYKKKK